jgi:hypothetical protein
MISNHRTLIVTLATMSTFVGTGSLAQVPAQQAPKPAAPRATATAPRATTSPTAAPAPTATAKKANPRGLPINSPALDRLVALIEYQKKKRAEIKNFSCPPNVTVAAGTGIGPATLAFTNASASQSICSGVADLAPAAERGGPCLTCNYQNGVSLKRSGPKSHACWVKPDAANGFACEFVPPLPASQTCIFEIDPGGMDLYPFGSHTRGDTDMYTEGSLFDPGSMVSMHVTVKLARSGNKLVWKLSGEAKETAPDHTTFSEQKTIDLKSSDVKNGTVADVETCLAAYGSQRPLTEPTTTYAHILDDEGWYNTDTIPSEGPLQFSMRCRVDTDGSDTGQVGCQSINVERFTINIK